MRNIFWAVCRPPDIKQTGGWQGAAGIGKCGATGMYTAVHEDPQFPTVEQQHSP